MLLRSLEQAVDAAQCPLGAVLEDQSVGLIDAQSLGGAEEAETERRIFLSKARFFLLVDLWVFFFFRFKVGETKKIKSFENDKLTGHFQSFFLYI